MSINHNSPLSSPDVRAEAVTEPRAMNKPISAAIRTDDKPIPDYGKPWFRGVHLAPRQHKIVHCLLNGMTNKQAAHHMGIDEGTVKVYNSYVFDKVGVRDRLELVTLYYRQRLHELEVMVEAKTLMLAALRAEIEADKLMSAA